MTVDSESTLLVLSLLFLELRFLLILPPVVLVFTATEIVLLLWLSLVLDCTTCRNFRWDDNRFDGDDAADDGSAEGRSIEGHVVVVGGVIVVTIQDMLKIQ